MRGNRVLTALLLVAVLVLAWWLVGVLFSAVWFLVRLVVVIVVALVILAVLRVKLGGGNRGR